jgi:hypothetical protein
VPIQPEPWVLKRVNEEPEARSYHLYAGPGRGSRQRLLWHEQACGKKKKEKGELPWQIFANYPV